MIRKLRKLKIRNYGPHKKLVVKFAPDITCIVGKSYAGKSTILRALKWVMTNKPSGTDFIRWNSKETKVSLYAGKKVITRTRSKTKNTYALDDEIYSSFNNRVPEPIERVCKVTENNFQRQHDTPFWFAESAGELNRRLNAIISLEMIDTVFSNIASMERRNKVLINDSAQRIKILRKEKKRLKDIKQVNADFENIVKLDTQKQELENEYFDLLSLVNKAQRLTKQKRKPPDIKPLEKLYQKINTYQQQHTDLTRIINRLQVLATEEAAYENEAAQIKKKLNQVKRCPVCQKPLNQ